MKRKKLALLTAITITAATLGACGKSEQETLAKADTEMVLQETEETELEEAETETEASIYNEDGTYKDFAEEYVSFESFESKKMYFIASSNKYENPNMTKGELVIGGIGDINTKIKVDGKCELNGVEYYRTTPNKRNQRFIVESKNLSDTPLTDTQAQSQQASEQLPPESIAPDTPTTNTDNNDNNNNNGGNSGNIEYNYDSDDLPPGLNGENDWGDIPTDEIQDGGTENFDPSTLDAAAEAVANMTFE